MPGVIDDLATSKAAGMLANDGAVLPDDDAIRISLNFDRPSNSLGGDRVLVPVKGDEACLRYRSHDRMKAVEAAGNGDQARPLRLERLPDGLILELGMLVGFGVGHAAVEEPGVQLVKALDPHSWREEALADQAHLVLRPAPSPSRTPAYRPLAPPDNDCTSAKSAG